MNVWVISFIIILAAILFFIRCSPLKKPVNKNLSDSYYHNKKGGINYSPMGNWFELGNEKTIADAATFEVLNRDFGKDKAHVFFKEHVIDAEIDKASFRVDELMAFDKEHVYIPIDYTPYDNRATNDSDNQLMVIEYALPDSYEEINSDWSKDAASYFYRNFKVDVDYATFEIVNPLFCKDRHSTYFMKSASLFKSSIVPKNVEKIDDRYIRDEKYIYDYQEYQNGELADLLISIPYQDWKSLKVIEDEYILIDSNVYYDGELIDLADRESFEVLSVPRYAKDKHQVFHLGKIIKNADPQHFFIFDYPIYTKDKNHIYYNGEVLEGADLESFGPSEEEFSLLYKDKNHTYRGEEILTDEELR